jgi:histidine triad (HIT) family protein
MADCEACEWINSEPKLYEDSKIVAVLAKNAINPGHIIVMPKNHYTILEQVPDYELAQLSKVANKLSIALFETMKIQGTNILIQNGLASHQSIPHFMIHIVPRMENDGHNFTWKPRQLSEEEMSTVEIQLKDSAKSIGNFEKEKPKPILLDSKPEEIKAGPKSGDGEAAEEVNYLLRQLERLP